MSFWILFNVFQRFDSFLDKVSAPNTKRKAPARKLDWFDSLPRIHCRVQLRLGGPDFVFCRAPLAMDKRAGRRPSRWRQLESLSGW